MESRRNIFSRHTSHTFFLGWLYDFFTEASGCLVPFLMKLIMIASYGACLVGKMFLADSTDDEIGPNGFLAACLHHLIQYCSDWKRFCTRPRKQCTTINGLQTAVHCDRSWRFALGYSGIQLGHSTRASTTTEREYQINIDRHRVCCGR